jgi:hypothetical protein
VRVGTLTNRHELPFAGARAVFLPDARAGADVQHHSFAYQSEPWQIVINTDDYVLASWQQIFAVIWRRETSVEAALHLRYACADFAREHPRGIGLLTVVGASAPLPTAAARKAVADFLAEGSAYIKCSAVVIEGSGFRSAAVRSVVTGLTLLAQQAYPHRVCDIEDAVRMFSRVLPAATGRTVDASAFRSSLEDLRHRADV